MTGMCRGMQLSFNLEYFGDCREVLNFYKSVFPDASVSLKTYREMDIADALGITGERLDLIWQSKLCIPVADSVLCLELSDSMMTALQKRVDSTGLFFHPVIYLSHEDENYLQGVSQKIYGGQGGFESLQDRDVPDPHGICWQCQRSLSCGISYCLTFEGFCRDALAFYEDVFQMKAAHVIEYRDSPCQEGLPAAGAGKIYSAELRFCHGSRFCALRLRDSLGSALSGTDSYDPNALLFYQKIYNPMFTLRARDVYYLSDAFRRLSAGAKLNRPLSLGEDGAVCGSLIDRYGICWNFYSREQRAK